MSRKHVLFFLLLAGLALLGGISGAQSRKPGAAAPLLPVSAPAALRGAPPLAPRAPAFDPELPLSELSLLGRFSLTLPEGTRWEIERPLEEGHFFLTLSPRPADLKQQLKPLLAQSEVNISLERDLPELAAIRVQERDDLLGPLLVWAGDREPIALDRLSRFYEPRGVISSPEGGQVSVHFGRAARLTPQQELCRLLRQPYPDLVPGDAEGREEFLKAEEAFASEDYDEALGLYRAIATPLDGTPELDFQRRRARAWRKQVADQEARKKAEEEARKEAEAKGEAPPDAPAPAAEVAAAPADAAPADAAPAEGAPAEVAAAGDDGAPAPEKKGLLPTEEEPDEELPFYEPLDAPDMVRSLAALRLGDLMVCLEKPRAARLRYELLLRGEGAGAVRRMASYQSALVAWPEVGLAEPLAALPELEQPEVQEEAGPLLGLLRVHAARVLLQAHEPERALEMIGRISEEHRAQMDGQYLAHFEERALGDAVNLRLRRGEDALLAGLVNQHKEIARRHRRFGSITRVTAEALRRLMLPERAVSFLQRALAESGEQDREHLSLLAQLARAYRESGDLYRAERTVRYLVEQMSHREGWLGRREEIEIGLAAAEVSMDQNRWDEARAWLRRAWGLGGGDSVDAMLAYAHGRELMAAGDRKGAAEALIHAARNRDLIPARRRAEVCLLTARLLEDFGRLDAAEDLLRRLMAETTHPEREVEVAWRLAHLLERRGEYEKAYGLYAEIALRDPDSSYSKIARYRAEEVEFQRQHADALTTLEILQPIDE